MERAQSNVLKYLIEHGVRSENIKPKLQQRDTHDVIYDSDGTTARNSDELDEDFNVPLLSVDRQSQSGEEGKSCDIQGKTGINKRVPYSKK
jgi:hypothetical protein